MTMEIKGSNILLSLFICLLVYWGIDYVSHNSIIKPTTKSVEFVVSMLLIYIILSIVALWYIISEITCISLKYVNGFKVTYADIPVFCHLFPLIFIIPISTFLFRKVKDWLDKNLTIKI